MTHTNLSIMKKISPARASSLSLTVRSIRAPHVRTLSCVCARVFECVTGERAHLRASKSFQENIRTFAKANGQKV